ncbi:hypothetical protein [Arthrobacter psychrolactophilus]
MPLQIGPKIPLWGRGNLLEETQDLQVLVLESQETGAQKRCRGGHRSDVNTATNEPFQDRRIHEETADFIPVSLQRIQAGDHGALSVIAKLEHQGDIYPSPHLAEVSATAAASAHYRLRAGTGSEAFDLY